MADVSKKDSPGRVADDQNWGQNLSKRVKLADEEELIQIIKSYGEKNYRYMDKHYKGWKQFKHPIFMFRASRNADPKFPGLVDSMENLFRVHASEIQGSDAEAKVRSKMQDGNRVQKRTPWPFVFHSLKPKLFNMFPENCKNYIGWNSEMANCEIDFVAICTTGHVYIMEVKSTELSEDINKEDQIIRIAEPIKIAAKQLNKGHTFLRKLYDCLQKPETETDIKIRPVLILTGISKAKFCQLSSDLQTLLEFFLITKKADNNYYLTFEKHEIKIVFSDMLESKWFFTEVLRTQPDFEPKDQVPNSVLNLIACIVREIQSDSAAEYSRLHRKICYQETVENPQQVKRCKIKGDNPNVADDQNVIPMKVKLLSNQEQFFPLSNTHSLRYFRSCRIQQPVAYEIKNFGYCWIECSEIVAHRLRN